MSGQPHSPQAYAFPTFRRYVRHGRKVQCLTRRFYRGHALSHIRGKPILARTAANPDKKRSNHHIKRYAHHVLTCDRQVDYSPFHSRPSRLAHIARKIFFGGWPMCHRPQNRHLYAWIASPVRQPALRLAAIASLSDPYCCLPSQDLRLMFRLLAIVYLTFAPQAGQLCAGGLVAVLVIGCFVALRAPRREHVAVTNSFRLAADCGFCHGHAFLIIWTGFPFPLKVVSLLKGTAVFHFRYAKTGQVSGS